MGYNENKIMKITDEKLDLIAYLTSPVIWVIMIGAIIYKVLEYIWKYIGLTDWFFIYFQMEKATNKAWLKKTASFARLKANKSKTLYSKWRFTKGAEKAESLL